MNKKEQELADKILDEALGGDGNRDIGISTRSNALNQYDTLTMCVERRIRAEMLDVQIYNILNQEETRSDDDDEICGICGESHD